MTNSWGDMVNSKLVVAQGSNFVENHPGSVQFVNEAIENGSKVVVVDPRRSRTASWAVQRGGYSFKIRPGSDLAITMGLINYAITNDRCDWVYLYNFTDAPFLMASSPLDTNTSTDYARASATGAPTQATVSSDQWSSSQCKTAVTTANTVFSYLTTRASVYTSGAVAQISGLTVGEFNTLASIVTDPANRPGSIYYAMGGTQHTYGSWQIKCYAMLQCVLGNMGVMGGGVNALRGIHNVQGSTDMGLLKGLIPGYSAPPGTGTSYFDYMDSLFGNNAQTGLQQIGFRNLLHAWFNQAATPAAAESGGPPATANSNYTYIPKGSSDDHITMFQRMKSGAIDALFCLGQNPAVTEPNLDEVRLGLEELDTLIVVDMYMNETATCDRKTGGRTILLPSCAHPEEAGSVTSSARLLYWRYMATPPKGNSRMDLWILLKIAKEISDQGGFGHIPLSGSYTTRYEQLYGTQYHPTLEGATGVPDFSVDTATTHPNGTPKYVGDLVAENVYKQMCAGSGSAPWGSVWIYTGAYDQAQAGGTTNPRYGSSLASGAATGATSVTLNNDVAATGKFNIPSTGVYAYIGNFSTDSAGGTFGNNSNAGETAAGNAELVQITGISGATVTFTPALTKVHAANEPFTVKGYWSYHASDGMLCKSRAFYDPVGNNLMPRFGWAWLQNRRIFYNWNPCNAASQKNSVNAGRPSGNYSAAYVTFCETCLNGPNATGAAANSCKAPGDARDYIVAPDTRARLLTHHGSDSTPLVTYTASQVYRTYNKLSDMDYPAAGAGGWSDTSSTYGNYRARFPKHWEPWESPSATLSAEYGRTGRGPTEGGAGWDYTNAAATGTPLLGDRTYYPLVLTTWRICWHFQGGPMSRNVPWLAELDPDPVIEINGTDAFNYGIADGDNVYIHTARQTGCGPFKARVGTGTQDNQNTKLGVVGIPWHWGVQKMGNSSYAALSEGASANEACIDASDGNTWIPESKACLCVITKTSSP